MIWVTDVYGSKVAINKEYVVAIFTVLEGDYKGKTGISLINGQIIVDETDLEIVGRLG